MSEKMTSASLFGLVHSNRDFTDKRAWGKNQFNSSFPASLSAYLFEKGLENIYLKINSLYEIEHSTINTAELFGQSPKSDELFYSFESQFLPFQKFLIGNIPRVDLVTQDLNDGKSLNGLEIKLTALPDNSTCDLNEDRYGTEIVARPDTIVYLVCSLTSCYENSQLELKEIIGNKFENLGDWSEIASIIPFIDKMFEILRKVSLTNINQQQPLILQPIWKTVGKSPKLAENCLDVFVWSNLAFMKMFSKIAQKDIRKGKITRQLRTVIWVCKMLFDFSEKGQFNHAEIIDRLSFNTRNDKAFALSGRATHPFMKCETLSKPRIKKDEIKHIILGGGQNLLSPERRFDAIIFNSENLFDGERKI